MLRISPMDSSDQHTLLKVEGRVVGPWVAELKKACEALLGEGRVLELNLAEVFFLDHEGATLLANIRDRGVHLVGCSPFVSEQLKAVEENA